MTVDGVAKSILSFVSNATGIADPMEPDEIVKSIESAFPANPVPKTTLRQRALTDVGMSREISDEEWEKVGSIDRNVPWPEISDKDLIECEDGIAHLMEPEFAYYLGALLRFAIRHLDSSIRTPQSALVSTIMFHLTDEPPAWMLHHVRSLRGSLNVLQTEAVRKFLKYVVSHSEVYGPKASRALLNYWETAKQMDTNKRS